MPDFFDRDDAEIVLGIGSVLDCRHGSDRLKIVLGAGYGGYEALPKIDSSWIIYWVRGPQTARLLGIDPALGLGDPAMLLPFTPHAGMTRNETPAKTTGRRIGFMPHFESFARGAWIEAAAEAGVRLIDPRADPIHVLSEISQCQLLISEAMHGVIIADTMRVPWIAVEPHAAVHRAKWYDWAGALNLKFQFHRLPPSTFYEWISSSPWATSQWARRAIKLAFRFGHHSDSNWLRHRAASAIRHVASGPGQLSEPANLLRCQERMLDRIARIRSQPSITRPTI